MSSSSKDTGTYALKSHWDQEHFEKMFWDIEGHVPAMSCVLKCVLKISKGHVKPLSTKFLGEVKVLLSGKFGWFPHKFGLVWRDGILMHIFDSTQHIIKNLKLWRYVESLGIEHKCDWTSKQGQKNHVNAHLTVQLPLWHPFWIGLETIV